MSTPGPDVPLLLDTNILVHVIRADPLGRHLVEGRHLRARPDAPMISVVTVGEILALAHHLNWGGPKRDHMLEILRELVVVDINRAPILERYAEIDAWSLQQGGQMGKNDLWIAATASVTNAALMTTDKDFDPIHKRFLWREYLDPDARY